MPADPRLAALRQLRDCGVIGEPAARSSQRLFALCVAGLAKAESRQFGNSWWRIFTLTERGQMLAATL